jgi:PAS domain S-box-containing protein
MPKAQRHNPFGTLKRRSLSLELTISLLLLVLLFEGILLGVVYRIQYRSYERELQGLADSYADNLSQVLAVPLWDYDDEQIAKIGTGYIRNPVVDEVRIADAEGNILYQVNKGTAEYDRVERQVKIDHRGQVIGQVDLYLSPQEHTAKLVWLRDVIVLILFASLVAILATTGILLRIFMRQPLKVLKNGIDRLAQGDYGYSFEEVHHSELRDIADRFSDMADTIRDREKSLQQEIVERHRAEEKIRESEAKSRALLDAIPDLMFRFDCQGTFLEFKGDEALLSVEPKKFLGKNVAEILSVEIASIMMQRLTQAIHSHQVQVFEYEMEIRGRPRHFESRLVAISNQEVVAIVRDISQRIEAAADRVKLEERLLRAQKMEAIGMLAGGVAHDLNNVLSGVVSYPELLLLDLPESSPLWQPIHTIQKSGEKAANIVQDLLTLARRGVSVSEVVNLNKLIREFQQSPEFEKMKADPPDFRLSLELDEALMNTTGSPLQLFKTIMNLAANAIEAITGQGIIKIQTQNSYVDRPLRGYDDIAPGDYVVMRVSDNGVGISPDNIDRIFEPFYTKKVMGRSGTGLGMAVVWGTIKDHQGYIEVDSQVGEGTCITVYLPASRQDVVQQPFPESLDQFTGRGETILVVDDMPEQLKIASQMLEKLGYRAVTAASGIEAVAYFKENTADLVILDMIMEPGMDGLDTYRQILAVHPEQKAIIASGFSETDRVRAAQALGAGEYIKKPYLLETISRVVRNELDR